MNIGLSALPERVQAKIYPEPNSGCWLWGGYVGIHGYGNICRSMGPIYVHRMVYELLVRPIPKKMILHHRCETRCCCNPEHLELISYKAHKTKHPIRNQYMGRTHCKYGHALTGDNFYMRPDRPNTRVCRACLVIARKKSKSKHKV